MAGLDAMNWTHREFLVWNQRYFSMQIPQAKQPEYFTKFQYKPLFNFANLQNRQTVPAWQAGHPGSISPFHATASIFPDQTADQVKPLHWRRCGYKRGASNVQALSKGGPEDLGVAAKFRP